MTDVARRFLVSGMVQGVGYRAFVRRTARVLGVSGYAENLGDGSVLVLARGAAESLGELERALARGPSFARVTHVAATDVPLAEIEPGAFEIK